MRSLWSLFLASAVLFGYLGETKADLIAYYNFDETSGTIAHDSVGSVNGTLINGAAFDPGAGPGGGGAISLKAATDDFVNMGDHFGFVGDGSFSLQAWIKLNPGDTTGMNPIGKHWSTISAGYFLGVNSGQPFWGAPNVACFFASYPTSGNSTIVVNDGNWHQLVGVYNTANDTISIYVDGLFQSASYGAGTIHSPNPSGASPAPFEVGGISISNGTPIGDFTGLISNVGVWDNALTSGEIQALYAAVSVPEPSAPTISLVVGTLGALGYAWRRRKRVP